MELILTDPLVFRQIRPVFRADFLCADFTHFLRWKVLTGNPGGLLCYVQSRLIA